VIKLLVERELLNKNNKRNLLSWKHSGFSIDNSVRILDDSSQESLAEYIARPPISLNKILYEPFKGRVLFHTKYSSYFKQNIHIHASCYVAIDESPVQVKQKAYSTRIGMYGHGSLCFDLGE